MKITIASIVLFAALVIAAPIATEDASAEEARGMS